MHGALNQQINGSDKWCLTPFIHIYSVFRIPRFEREKNFETLVLVPPKQVGNLSRLSAAQID